ncbi:hypothetical protein [Enterococcus sp. AZ007]|uniref:hypothetical protein n=1 Tax=Enterococcus sp. AZ007 TaxID=2774839 RepID=UPI003F25F396
MITMIKADIFRIQKGRLFRRAFFLLVGLGIFSGITSKGNPDELMRNGLSGGAMFVSLVMLTLMVVIWGHEFSFRTVNNVLAAKTSRTQYFINKLVLSYLCTIVFYLVFVISLLLTVLFTSGSFNFGMVGISCLLQLIFYIAAVSLGIFLFNSVSQIYLSVCIFTVLALLGDNIITGIVSEFFKSLDIFLNTLIFTNMSVITHFNELNSQTILLMISSAVIYSGIMVGISLFIFKNKEFK